MYLGHCNGDNQLGQLGIGIKDIIKRQQALLAQQAEAARIKAAVEAEVQRLVPTAEETAEAFVVEMKTIAPTAPVEKPTVVTPPDSRLAPPAPITADQSLIERYRAQVTTPIMVTTPVDSRVPTPVNGAPPPAEQKGAGIGTVLALGIPIVLAMAG